MFPMQSENFLITEDSIEGTEFGEGTYVARETNQETLAELSVTAVTILLVFLFVFAVSYIVFRFVRRNAKES
jgi:heme/copper-type cytochrome/quinol oxidase subunit 2